MATNAQYESMRLNIACLVRENEELRGKLAAAELDNKRLTQMTEDIFKRAKKEVGDGK